MGTGRARAHDLWKRFIAPEFIGMLESLDFGRNFVRAEGARLVDEEGRSYIDLLAGYGVHNTGHNHPRIVDALRDSLASNAPSMLNIDAPLPAGLLAERLTSMTHPSLCRTIFASSGAEAVEAAIKAARGATGRQRILSCYGGYHGLSTGALSLLGDDRMQGLFGPLLAGVTRIPYGDSEALQEACDQLHPAAFFVEPIQGEGGIHVPPPSYLREAREICLREGCLLVIDEIQTGLGRTGSDFATDFDLVVPDILLVGKALSGGLVPVAAAILTGRVWDGAFGGPARCVLATSTFARGRLAMVAGLEALRVLEDERLSERAAELGAHIADRLRAIAARHEIIEDVRGLGLLFGIEFRESASLARAAIPKWVREGLFVQVLSAQLLCDHRCVTQPCGLAPRVLRIEPPLVISREDVDRFLDALDAVLAVLPNYGAAVREVIRKIAMFG